jgi:Spy/CpxP family protein refolding chaperone
LTILMATATQAQPDRQGYRGLNYGDRTGRLDYLDLTDEQSEQLTQLRTDHYNAMKPLRAKMDEIRARERTLMAEKSVDLKEVEKVIDQQTELSNEMRKLQVKHQLAMKAVLTDEQVMKLEQGPRRPARMGQAPGYGRGQVPRDGRGSGWRNDRGPRGYGWSGSSI